MLKRITRGENGRAREKGKAEYAFGAGKLKEYIYNRSCLGRASPYASTLSNNTKKIQTYFHDSNSDNGKGNMNLRRPF
jgi:hypothetical protein